MDPLIQPGRTDVSDLSKSTVVMWQRKYYFHIAFIFGILVPWSIAGLGWDDWRGGLFYACFARIVAVHHVSWRTFIVVSHFLGLMFVYGVKSLSFRSTQSLIGLVQHLMTIGKHLANITSPPFLLSERAITIFTTSSLWIIATLSSTTNLIQQSGSSTYASRSGLQATYNVSA